MEEEFELVTLANGVTSLRSVGNGQTFHPVVGPVAEAQAVHLAGTRLVERANACAAGGFTIWDVGLGAAANATVAIASLAAGYHGASDLRLLSFDRTFGALDFALVHARELGYPLAYLESLRSIRREGECAIPLAMSFATLHWSACVADFSELMSGSRALPAPHAIFFDPYSPAVNREMWTLELFRALWGRLRADVPCLLTTYTRSTAVRVTLLLAGFHVGIGHSTGEKNETTIAANDVGLLERPLGRDWLEKKVYASTNAAPLRMSAVALSHAPIAEADYASLLTHPQFQI